jgi:hypothetical protein
MKKPIAILLAAAKILMLLALSGCSDGAELELPTYEDLQSITVQEIENGRPVSREVTLYDELHPRLYTSPDYIRFDTDGFRQITNESQITSADKCIAYRFIEKSGNSRLLNIYSDEKYNYIEEPGIGVWREKRPQNQWTLYELSYDVYEDNSWAQAFLNTAKDKIFTLLPEYNGAEKAIFVDISEETVNDWVERFIPEAFAASRAEDVRYVVLCEVASKTYEGYWYVPETGEELGDSYEVEYKATVYDLATGDTIVLVEMTVNGMFEIPDYINTYFASIQ